MAEVMDVLRFRSKTKSKPMVPYPWQGTPAEGAQEKDEKSNTQATAHNTDGDITVYDDLGATDKELADGEL